MRERAIIKGKTRKAAFHIRKGPPGVTGEQIYSPHYDKESLNWGKRY